MSTPWWQVAWSPPLKRGSQHSFHEPLGGVEERIHHVQHPGQCLVDTVHPENHGALPAPTPAQPGSEGGRKP